jgi:hypothetical protein
MRNGASLRANGLIREQAKQQSTIILKDYYTMGFVADYMVLLVKTLVMRYVMEWRKCFLLQYK